MRGKSQQTHIYDECIDRYLKNEERLKADGRKMKLLYERELIINRVMFFEEKQKLEKGITSDILNERLSKGSNLRNDRILQHENGSRPTLEKLGPPLFYIGSDAPLLLHSTPLNDSEIVPDYKCEDAHAPEDCTVADVHKISENEHEDTDNERADVRPKAIVTRV